MHLIKAPMQAAAGGGARTEICKNYIHLKYTFVQEIRSLHNAQDSDADGFNS